MSSERAGNGMSEPSSIDDADDEGEEDVEPFVKPAFEYIRVRIDETFNRELSGPARKAAEDIWKNWEDIRDAVTEGDVLLVPDPFFHSVKYPSLSNFHMYRGFGIILLGTGAVTAVIGAALASMFGPVLWQGSLICLAIGAGAFFWGRTSRNGTRVLTVSAWLSGRLASGGRRDRRPLRRIPFGLHRVRGSARPDILAPVRVQCTHRQNTHRRRARPPESLAVIARKPFGAEHT